VVIVTERVTGLARGTHNPVVLSNLVDRMSECWVPPATVLSPTLAAAMEAEAKAVGTEDTVKAVPEGSGFLF